MPLDQIDDIDNYDEKEVAGSEMSFLDHLDVLRWHIIRSAIALIVLMIVVFVNKDFVFDVVLFGPRYEWFPTYRFMCGISESMCINPPKFDMIAIGISEKFMNHMYVTFWFSMIMGFPYFLWEIWRFVKPGLYIKEQKSLNLFVFVCTFLFAIGVLFGYFVVAPLAINFLVSYEITDVKSQSTLESYVDSMVMFTLPLGLVFELPVLAYILGKLGIVTASFMVNSRKIAFVILLVVAGFITPSPDIMSQLLVFAPLYTLYEVSIFVVKRIEKNNKALAKLEN